MKQAKIIQRRHHNQLTRRKRAALTFAFCLLPFAFVLWPSGGSAHEPITTKIMFNKEVVRVFRRNCLGCHREGGIAPWSFATYEEARPWAKAIKEELLEKRMPPWPAVEGYGDFRNAFPLTQREIDMIVNWVEGGAPPGKTENLPKEPLFSDDWQMGKPDLILKPESEYEVASDADEHRSFILPTNLKEDRWIRAVDLRPGNGSVVHCATIYAEKGGDAARIGISRKSESRKSKVPDLRPLTLDFGLRRSRSHAPNSPASLLDTWVPGQERVALPHGVGWLVPAGSRVVLKIHYRGSGEAVKDSSAVGIYFADSHVHKHAREVAVTNSDAVIPAGAKAHRVDAAFTLQHDGEAVAIRPVVNPLVVSLQATAYRPDGTQEVLVWTRGYKYDWQPTYYYKRPVPLPKGTRIEVIAYFDNSETNRGNPNSPPKQARWGDIGSEPLCALVVASNHDGPDPTRGR